MFSAVPRWDRVQARALAPIAYALLLLSPPEASSQTVRPVIVEYVQKARGKFDLINDTVLPVNVVLEAKSFTVSEDGTPVFLPLDKGIHLKLSGMSFRIPPQQTYYVFYEASADMYPAWFVVYATFAGLPRQSGLNVQVELPHTVYLLQKGPLEESAVEIRRAHFNADSRRVRVELENTGDRFGRVLQVEVLSNRDKSFHPGFPLMPHSRRRLEINWASRELPRRLLVRFGKFKKEAYMQDAEELTN